MKALVYHGPGKKAREEVARPAIEESTDPGRCSYGYPEAFPGGRESSLTARQLRP